MYLNGCEHWKAKRKISAGVSCEEIKRDYGGNRTRMERERGMRKVCLFKRYRIVATSHGTLLTKLHAKSNIAKTLSTYRY